MAEGVGNESPQLRSGEQAFPVALVHPFFGTIPEAEFIFAESLEVPRLRMVVVPNFEFLTPSDKLGDGEGIGESEGDEIGAAVLLPMGKVAAGLKPRPASSTAK